MPFVAERPAASNATPRLIRLKQSNISCSACEGCAADGKRIYPLRRQQAPTAALLRCSCLTAQVFLYFTTSGTLRAGTQELNLGKKENARVYRYNSQAIQSARGAKKMIRQLSSLC